LPVPKNFLEIPESGLAPTIPMDPKTPCPSNVGCQGEPAAPTLVPHLLE